MTTAKITKQHIAGILTALALAAPGAAFASTPTQPNTPKAPAMEHKAAESKAEKKKAKTDAAKKATPDQKAAVRH